MVDRLAQAVRQQLRPGRLLPLGEAADGLWLTERAAVSALRESAAGLPGMRISGLRVALAEPGQAAPLTVPAPPGALPPGPLRVEARIAVAAGQPIPGVAGSLRAALLRTAVSRVGLPVTAVDVHVAELLDGLDPHRGDEGRDLDHDDDSTAGAGFGSRPSGAIGPDGGPAAAEEGPVTAAARAAAGAPGVAGLAPVLGGATGGVEVNDVPEGGRHVLLQLAVVSGHRAVDVARAARDAAWKALARGNGESGTPGGGGTAPVTVTVLVTDLDAPRGGGT